MVTKLRAQLAKFVVMGLLLLAIAWLARRGVQQSSVGRPAASRTVIATWTA